MSLKGWTRNCMRTETSANLAERMRFVLTPTQLKGLKEHKYSSQGISLLEYYGLNSFWSWLVEFVPRWVAPNLITFIGFSASLVTTLATILHDPNAEGKVRGHGWAAPWAEGPPAAVGGVQYVTWRESPSLPS